jgi:hypothetical protein
MMNTYTSLTIKRAIYIHMCTIEGNNQPTLLVKAKKTKKK